MKDKFRFSLCATLALSILVVGTLVMLVTAIVTGFQARRLYREKILAAISRLILRVFGIKLRVHQEEAFPQGQVIYISNHSSTIDLFVLTALKLPNSRFFLRGSLRKTLPLCMIGYMIGVIWTVPQDYPEKRRRIFRKAERILRVTGESVFLSPEGKRITSGEIGHFNKGAFHLATALGVPIIPLYIHIPPEMNPGRGLNAKPGQVDFFVMPTIDTNLWCIEDLHQNKTYVRNLYVGWHEHFQSGADTEPIALAS
jgi:1-acyl-sn-glycerol-3-phosphate acyltransferase